ncbi:MAG: YbaY family lipoprotein [Sphingomonadaceae bacterium]|nr:YbaY family lipoprotein [Sphingomonadaceae bacterium]
MMKAIKFGSFLLAPALLAACTTTGGYQQVEKPIFNLGETSSVTGQLTYRERMALPPGAYATITLSDIARADAPAPVINQIRYDLTNVSVPFQFSLERPNQLDQRVQLNLRATIHDANGKLMFTTDTVQPVMTRPVDQDLGMITMVRTGR